MTNIDVDSRLKDSFWCLPLGFERDGELGRLFLPFPAACVAFAFPTFQRSSHFQWSSLRYPTQPGQVGGHEGVGKVVKLGPGSENSTVKVGDRVGVKWVAGICGSCRELRSIQPLQRAIKANALL